MSKQIDQSKIYCDPKLKLKYQILNRLGQGCFGTIYKAINRKLKTQVALKLQITDQGQGQNQRRSKLINQIAILQKLKNIPGIPKLYGAGKWSLGFYMQIQLLSSSLSDERNKQYSEVQIYSMVSELIQILRKIHQKGIIHQDLKPQNIMRNDSGNLVIIDFGLSIYTNPNIFESNRGFVGTPRYASLAAHLGLTQKPKDDIQSLLYVMGVVYMKKAPWFQLKGPASKRLQKIQKYKKANSLDWFKSCSQSFVTAYEYLMPLKPTQQLDYNYLLQLFQFARKRRTLKSVKIPYQNVIKQQLKQYQRRNSHMQPYLLNLPLPKISVFFAQKSDKQNTQILSHQKLQQISYSNNNFSQMAQDGYIEFIQILTHKILDNFEDNMEQKIQQKYENIGMNIQLNNQQYGINNINKYQGLMFKNPFFYM